MTAPIQFSWDGDSFVPLARFRKTCDHEFVVGEIYRLAVQEERSAVSHNHYFACLNEIWKNLPDELAARYPSVEHLRKRALIKAGYFDERSLVLGSPEQAQAVATLVNAMDDYAVVVVRDAVIKVFTAKSQSAKAMDKREFQRSKTLVLEILADLIGVELRAVADHAKSAEAA
jgi:hypothetical protein